MISDFSEKVQVLREAFSGELVFPDMPAYEDLKIVFNADGQPALIARCQTEDDVRAVVDFAQSTTLVLSVRSGGHGLVGLATNNDGVVLDLTPMNGITVLDEAHRLVRIESGATWGQVAHDLRKFGLALTAGDTPTVGVGGLTLGGGIGWMVRKYGLTIDSLRAATIVLANGATVRATATEQPDLFWAIRGGGGNFGVVTSFEFEAQPITIVHAGKIQYDVALMHDVLTGWATYMELAPEELTSTISVLPPLGPNPPALYIEVCYAGSNEAAANEAINPLLHFGVVRQQTVAAMEYEDFIAEHVLPTPPGLIKRFTRSGFLLTLNEEIVGLIAEHYGKPQTPVLQLRALGGAMARVDPGATAFAHRDSNVLAVAAATAWAQVPESAALQQVDRAWSPLERFSVASYLNFIDRYPEDPARIYPDETYRRLKVLKARYDPQDLFSQNFNLV